MLAYFESHRQRGWVPQVRTWTLVLWLVDHSGPHHCSKLSIIAIYHLLFTKETRISFRSESNQSSKRTIVYGTNSHTGSKGYRWKYAYNAVNNGSRIIFLRSVSLKILWERMIEHRFWQIFWNDDLATMSRTAVVCPADVGRFDHRWRETADET